MVLSKSKKISYLLTKMGIFSYLDVIAHYPRKYDDFSLSDPKSLFHLKDKEKVVLFGRLATPAKNFHFRNTTKTTFLFSTDTLDFQVVAWNRPYLSTYLQMDEDYTLEGSYDGKKHQLNFLQIKKGRLAPEDTIVPIYRLPEDYPQHHFRSLVAKSLEEVGSQIEDIVPPSLNAKYKLIRKKDAVRALHFPIDREDLHQGKRALKYEEALLFSLKNQLIRKQNKIAKSSVRQKIDRAYIKSYIHHLSYELTSSQKTALGEIINDMDDKTLMYRLLQGDVGMGKTLVAFLAMLSCASRQEQSALMAPTDALAKQHYQNVTSMLEGTPYKAVLLVGSLPSSKRKEVLGQIASGEVDMIIGTHALFSRDVDYASLGLAVIDEQHKFGVNQRSVLASKGEGADLLLMSATPIPRTLALTLYGDLDVSTLTEFPSKQRDIVTKIVKTSDSCVKKEILGALNRSSRVYIVAPQIEENGEDSSSSVLALEERYEKMFPGKVSLLHGRLDDLDKEVAFAKFASGLTPILVATSVIEVGIDVKEADLMIIHDATHFSLSSLHQLRGRIGRNGQSSTCLLCYDGNDEEDLDKLNVLVQNEDGFAIAEEDLSRRGPGEISGTKQSGLPDLAMANIVNDFRMFEAARDDASYILSHPELEGFGKIISLASKELGEFVP